MSNKILVVDDERSIMNIIAFNLKKEGYSVVCAEDGEQALMVFEAEQPDLILLDVMMPKIDGFGVCKEIRKVSQVPIIMLTARADEMDKVFGLDLGADDYVTKPFSNKELIARVKANIRRSPLQMQQVQQTYQIQYLQETPNQNMPQVLNNNNNFNNNNNLSQHEINHNKFSNNNNLSQYEHDNHNFNNNHHQDLPENSLQDTSQKKNSINFTSIVKASTKEFLLKAKNSKKPKNMYGDLKIDFERFEVFKKRKAINLTTREFELLRFLATNQSKIFTREELLSEVWGYTYIGDIRAVDVGIRRLREKIEDDASNPKYILTKRGIGYYFGM